MASRERSRRHMGHKACRGSIGKRVSGANMQQRHHDRRLGKQSFLIAVNPDLGQTPVDTKPEGGQKTETATPAKAPRAQTMNYILKKPMGETDGLID